MTTNDKRILIFDWIGFASLEVSIGQAMREVGITSDELDRTYVDCVRGRDGDYELWLEVRNDNE